jgi:hypothetical protein
MSDLESVFCSFFGMIGNEERDWLGDSLTPRTSTPQINLNAPKSNLESELPSKRHSNKSNTKIIKIS